MNLRELKDEADIRAADLGHAFVGWSDDYDGHAAFARCKYCRASVTVDESPLTESRYQMFGFALEVPCPGRCPHPEVALITYIDKETGDTVQLCGWCDQSPTGGTVSGLTEEDRKEYKGPGIHWEE